MAAAYLALGLWACTPQPPAAHNPTLAQLPTLPSIRSRITPPHPASLDPHSRPLAIAQIERLDLPLDRPLERIEPFLDTSGLNEAVVQAWHANGLRAGLVDPSLRNKLTEDLGAPLSHQTTQTVLTGHPQSLGTSGPIHDPRSLQLTLPDQSPQTLRLTSGRLQWLLRCVPDSTGAITAIELVPHHFQPKATVQPREPWEKALDGRVFEQLALKVTLPLNRVLVVAPDWPQAASAPPQEASTPEPPDTAGAGSAGVHPAPIEPPNNQASPEQTHEPAHRQDPSPTLPPNLGTGLLTASRFGRPVQAVFLITLSPVEQPPPHPLSPP